MSDNTCGDREMRLRPDSTVWRSTLPLVISSISASIPAATTALTAMAARSRTGRGTFNDMGDDDPETTFGHVAEKLNGGALAYLHIVNPAVAAIEKGIEPDLGALRMLELCAKDTAARSSSRAVLTTTPRRAGSNKGRRI